jgi:two-component system, NarL family, sensor histidine kinase EvgS
MAAPAATPVEPLSEASALSLHSFSGGDVDTERRFLQVLLVANQSDLEALAVQVEAGNWLEAADRAHRIKGVARLVAAIEVDRDCERLERACKASDPAEVRLRLAELAASVGALDAAIRVRLAGMADDAPPQP